MGKKRKKPLPLLEQIEITAVAAEGKALARVGEKVLFVPFAAPGDVVDVQVRKTRKNYMEGVVRQVHRHSPLRVEPFCEHFGLCGGCKWQHLPYEQQLVFKQQEVADKLQRIGKLDMAGVEVLPIAASSDTRFYRNKLEYTFSNRRWLTREEISTGEKIANYGVLGFHIPGLFDKVLDIDKCWLQAEPSNEIRLGLKHFARENGLSFYDLRANQGLLRNLIIRNTPGGQCMVIVVFGQEDKSAIEQVLQYIEEAFPGLHSLFWMLNEKRNSSIADLEAHLFAGSEFLTEQMEDLHFRVGPKTFFQTNSRQALVLYSIMRDFAALEGHEMVYDLYTGAGTIACFLARQAKKVLGIEYVEEAVADARVNASQNGIDNAVFVAGDMAAVLNESLMEQYGRPDVIITDPPRAGMHPRVVEQILGSGAGRVVYVSCNPASQARDIELLSGGYDLVRIRAVDMFPHTHHVENIALLRRRDT